MMYVAAVAMQTVLYLLIAGIYMMVAFGAIIMLAGVALWELAHKRDPGPRLARIISAAGQKHAAVWGK